MAKLHQSLYDNDNNWMSFSSLSLHSARVLAYKFRFTHARITFMLENGIRLSSPTLYVIAVSNVGDKMFFFIILILR